MTGRVPSSEQPRHIRAGATECPSCPGLRLSRQALFIFSFSLPSSHPSQELPNRQKPEIPLAWRHFSEDPKTLEKEKKWDTPLQQASELPRANAKRKVRSGVRLLQPPL